MSQSTAGERLSTVLFYGVLFLLAYLVFRIFQPFLVPLGWAGVLVVVFYPWHARLENRWGRTPAAAASTLGVTLILIVPTLVLMVLFAREAVDAARGVQHAVSEGQYPLVHRAWEWISQRALGADATDLPTLVRQYAERIAGLLAGKLGTVLRNVVVFLFDLFVVLFALFFLFRDAGQIVTMMRRLLPFGEAHREQMLAEARDLIYASVTTSLIIAAVQGLLGGIAFALVGLGAPIFWGVIMAFFSLLPVVGAWLIWVPAAIWLLASGHSGRALVLAAICAGVVGTVDNFLRPILISGRARLSGLLVFISVLGGISVFGMLGLVLGPIIVATVAGILDVYLRTEKAT